MPKERDVFKMIWTNFRNFLRPRQIRGNLIGKDNFGNQYFEIPADPSIGKRKDARWFEPVVKDNFMQEMPAEWEAWLRGRRKEPPTVEEVLRNQAIADMKKVNAAELEKEYNPEGVTQKKPETVQVTFLH
ncbi:Mimitin, mitochondrial, partial [Orchesella cincta]